MAELNITMKQLNNQGQYDTLYPQTTGENIQGLTFDQVEGSLDGSRVSGSIPSSQITGQIPASQVSYSNSSTSSIITSNQVQGAIDQLFTSVSNGKSLIAGAITDKGVSTSANDSFSTMASNIGSIQTGANPSNIDMSFVPATNRSSSAGTLGRLFVENQYIETGYIYFMGFTVVTTSGSRSPIAGFVYFSDMAYNAPFLLRFVQNGVSVTTRTGSGITQVTYVSGGVEFTFASASYHPEISSWADPWCIKIDNTYQS